MHKVYVLANSVCYRILSFGNNFIRIPAIISKSDTIVG